MFNINKTVTTSVITTIIILMFALSYMSRNIVPVINNEMDTVKFNNEGRIRVLENEISSLKLKVSNLEKEISNIKPTISPSVTPSPTITPTTTPTPKKENKIIENNKPIKLNREVKNNKTYENSNIPSTNSSVYTVSTDITKKSGLDINSTNKLLKYIRNTRYNGTDNFKLLNKGEVFVRMENTYNVNTLYAIAVSITETSMGTAGVGRQNNLFAFINKNGNGYRVYESVDNSIMDFGKSAREYYFDRSLTSINKIAPIYCPPNSTKWSNTVSWLISHYGNEANKILQN